VASLIWRRHFFLYIKYIKLPLVLKKGDRIFITEGQIHRVLKSTTNLKIKKKIMNKELLRMQMLAGVITESQYKEKIENLYEASLKPKEKAVFDDIINTLNEGEGWIEKFKNYAKKGLITIGIITALLSGSMLNNSQKEEVRDVIKTEITVNLSDLTIGGKLLDFYENNPELAQQYKQENPISTLVDDIENVIQNNNQKDTEWLKFLGSLHGDEADSFTSFSTYYY
jgi:hypothetical protein